MSFEIKKSLDFKLKYCFFDWIRIDVRHFLDDGDGFMNGSKVFLDIIKNHLAIFLNQYLG